MKHEDVDGLATKRVGLEAELEMDAERRGAELFARHRLETSRRIDHTFLYLLVFEWVALVFVALTVSPYTWAGSQYRTHPHVWGALILGGIIVALPVWMILRNPGGQSTRHVVAAAQALMSVMLIHLTGGRIETHFHVFGSLAFLALYRDWRVLLTATVITSVDHFLRGTYWPESVFGVSIVEPWRWVEHAGWVLFEDAVLVPSCIFGLREERASSRREAMLEAARARVEWIVAVRTGELAEQVEKNERVIERLRAGEAELRKLSLVASKTDNVVVITDALGRIEWVNAGFTRITEYTLDEVIGRTPGSFLAGPETSREVSESMRASVRSGEGFRVEIVNYAKSGRKYWLAINAQPIHDENGKLTNFIAIESEISDRKAAEEVLRASRERFELAVAGSSAGIWDWDIERDDIECSPRMYEITGRDPGRHWNLNEFMSWVHSDDRELLHARVEAHLLNRMPFKEVEYRLLFGDGLFHWVEASGQATWDKTGLATRMVGSLSDIGARKHAEAARETASRELENIMETIPDLIYVLDHEGRLVRWNKRVETATGLTSKELLGRRNVDFFPESRREQVLESARTVFTEGFDEMESEIYVAGGRLAVHQFSSAVLRTQDGRVIGLAGMARDITEARRAQAELEDAKNAAEAASRAKSEFLANVSHEIRTPMNGIIGMTELALDTDLSREQREYLEMVKSSADGLLTVINDILDFSKIEAGKLELDPVAFDLREAIGDTMRFFGLQAHEKNIELVCDIRPEVPATLLGDPARLRQIVVNLVGNAIKFTDRGEIVVRVERVEAHPGDDRRDLRGDPVELRFSVSDTGIGIPADKQRTIFNAFEQADGSTTRRYGGTGLGLAISMRLVEMMGGRIGVSSRVGHGSTFFFNARLRIDDGPPERARPEASAGALRDVPVLVVDDNATNRRILVDTLARWEMRPSAVESAPDALASMRRAAESGRRFAIVLIDAMMPVTDGFELARSIHDDPALAGSTIMMLSSAGGREDAALCRTLGVSQYLVKPVKQSDLLDAIMNVLFAAPGTPREPDAATPQPANNTLNARPLRLLLAEDNAVNQKLAVRLLERRGHQVVVVDDGQQALDAFEAARGSLNAFDLVLMDVQMPNLGGLEAAAIIRRREQAEGGGRRTPIIAMTARAMKGDREECLKSGFDGYVSKPLRPQKLFDLIDELRPRDDELADGRRAPVFDRAALEELTAGDFDLLREIVRLFLDDCPRMLAAIERDVRAGDLADLHQSAHEFKGSVANLAAPAAFDAARRLEEIARSGVFDRAAAERAWSNLARDVDALRDALRTLLQPVDQPATT